MYPMKRIALAMATVAIFPAWQAGAADYDPPIYVEAAEEYVPVEIGSGWYLRGDVAYNFARSYKDSSFSLDGWLADNPLTVGRFDVFSYSEKENPVSGSIGFGYHFNDYLRADINIGILASDDYSATFQFDAGGEVDVTVENSAWNGLVNGYIDLGTYAGLTPYVGAGIGVLYTRTKVEGTASFRQSNYDFMYALAAGVSYQMTKNASIDVGYQYIDAPGVDYYAISDDSVELREGMSSNQFKVGLRYDLW